MSDTEHKPETRTAQTCMDLREQCQDKIFGAMKKNHDEVMGAIGTIKEDVAFMKGQQAALHPSGSQPAPIPVSTNTVSKKENGKINWGEVILQVIISWAPGLGLLLVLGLIAILRSKGWL